MALDAAKNFAKATVSTGYNAGATSIVLTTGHAARLPAAPFNCVWFDADTYPDPSDDPNREIVRVTNIASDTLTITRAQEGTSASTKNTAGKTYKLIAGPTKKTIDDITAALATKTALGWYVATENGLAGDGVTDDTAALKALINTVAAAGGGTIYFPPGCYLIGGPFISGTEAQIPLPIVDEADPFVTIHLIGALPATNSFWYFSTDSPTGAPYSVIKSTATGGSDVNALFRGQMDVGAVFYNNLVMRYSNLIIALPANPTFTAIDMTQDCGGWIDDCLVYAGTIDLDAVTEPTFPNSYGVKLPGSNHSSGTKVQGLAVTGFYNGLLDGEASQIDNVAIQGCQRALVETHCVYPGMHGFVGIYFCPKSIVMDDAQPRYLTIRQLDLENPHSPAAAWQVLINHCDDPDNFLYGSVQWYGAAANVPSIVKDGGENLIFTKIGDIAGVLPPPTFSTGEVGSVSASTVVIGFSEPIKATSYTAGVTIEVNGSPATISSATRQTDKSIVRYVIASPVDGGDTVEFSYSAIDGFIQNELGVHLADVAATEITNNAAAGPFSPDEVTGLVLWLAADELALADNDPVATWADQSVAANDATQGTSGARPTFKAAQINSLPVVRFDGTNDYLALDGNLSSQDFTYFAVVKHTAANQGILIGHDNGGISWDFAGSGDNKPRLVKASTALVGQATTDIGSGYAIIALSYATPNVIFYRNGGADGSASSAQTFSFLSTGAVGCQFSGAAPSFWFAGDVAEIICYDNVVSSGDRAALFAYLNDKYAVY